MLSFNRLGNLGRLANQMFQYASLKGIAKNCGHSFAIPPREVFGQFDLNVRNSDIILYDVFDLESKNEVGIDKNTDITVIRVNPKYFRPAEVETLLGDSTKAKEKLGWEPKTYFKQLVEDMCIYGQ